jgi:hypothetical protein
MLIGFWVVHAILTHGHKICIQNEEEKKSGKTRRRKIMK